MRPTILLALLVPFGACKVDHSLGSVPADSGIDVEASANQDSAQSTLLEAGGGSTNAPPSTGVDGDAVGPLGPVESWTGGLPNFAFPSGSDAIKLNLASDSAGNVAGQVVLGNDPPPLHATDPNVAYPPVPIGVQVVEGFPYTITGGSMRTNRLRFTMRTLEPWTGWCALQTPADDGSFSCWPSSTNSFWSPPDCAFVDPVTGEKAPIDCGKMFLCSDMACVCSSSGCRVRAAADEASELAHTLSFDVAVSGTIAMGVMVAEGGGSQDVVLVHDP